MSEKPLVPTYCYFQGCYNPDYEEEIRKGKELCHRCNALSPNDREAQAEILASLLGHVGRETYITPLFGAITDIISASGTISMPIITW